MPDQVTLEALREAFWGFYLLTLALVAARTLWSRWWVLGRCGVALVFASAAQWAIERKLGPQGYLLWYHHMAIDFAVFVIVVTPPLRYWQAVLGALVLGQMVLHGLWFAAPEMGRWHWLLVLLIGFAKCAVLLLWCGGPELERLGKMVGRGLHRLRARLVPAVAGKQLAR